MTGREPARVFSIPPGVAFLPTLARALVEGELAPGFRHDGDPLKFADATVYVPTRRAARALRSAFVELAKGSSAILPVIRALGEFDEDDAAFDLDGPEEIDMPPAISPVERLLLLAPLVHRWRQRLPGHIRQLFDEEVVVPASMPDAIWLARDLAALMDEVETGDADWGNLRDLVGGDFANWWQVTLDFLAIVTENWPALLAGRDRSNPAAHRNARILAEARRLARNPPPGPVIAAGSTGSIPATAELLGVIARLPSGALVLPGLDAGLDDESWSVISAAAPSPSVLGHPQYGLARLLEKIGVRRDEVHRIGAPSHAQARRAAVLSEAMRPSETTDTWASNRTALDETLVTDALEGVSLVEAANERDEALAIAVALRLAIAEPGRLAALVTPDRNLARRVAAELERFGVDADDSGGAALSQSVPATLLTLTLEAVFRPGDPVPVLALLKHRLLSLGADRTDVRRACETIELVALRRGVGRPDIADLARSFEERLSKLGADKRAPFWRDRLTSEQLNAARGVLARLTTALGPLTKLRGRNPVRFPEMVETTVRVLEDLARGPAGDVAELYKGDAGQKLADFLRSLVSVDVDLELSADEWPDMMTALIAPEAVKPSAGGDSRVFIWGTLEARLQHVDTLVLGGLNEGSWPRKAEADRFMSRMMKGGLELEPPERRIGQAAHDFVTAMGGKNVVLTRSARSGDAPAVASRWLQRLTAFIGPGQARRLRERGAGYLHAARSLDGRELDADFERPRHAPPLAARPKRFSVTEVETLRRDPYAIYAKKVLELRPIEPLVRDPGAAERGTLFHAILHRFTRSGVDVSAPDALARLLQAGREEFALAALPADIEAVWWPRFAAMAPNLVDWERQRGSIRQRLSEEHAKATMVGASGVELSGYADRIDILPAGYADILDYKTGVTPSKGQAHTLLAPQLALEGALLMRGAFEGAGKATPSLLAHVRLKANGEVIEEPILEFKRQTRTADDLSNEAWKRLEQLLHHYADPATGYLSRALPFREGDTSGDYDHLARVLEWSADGEEDSSGDEP
jgi:ATP-dependent helicase/nuclease subunit B